MTKPLEGVRVVDLSQITSGPLGTMVMAEQGADVIKVESPGIGDLSRFAPNSRNGVSSFILNQNRGKRSIAIDLQSDGGRDFEEWRRPRVIGQPRLDFLPQRRVVAARGGQEGGSLRGRALQRRVIEVGDAVGPPVRCHGSRTSLAEGRRRR